MLNQVRISDFLHQVKHPAVIKPESEYSLVTVRLHHRGVALREKKMGSLVGSKMYRVSEGQFILSGIDARNGAFGIVPKELDGAIVTSDFWVFEIDETIIRRDYFYWLTNTPLFLNVCIKTSRGETQRIRLQKTLFYNYELQIPSIEDQEEYLKRIIFVNQRLGQLNDTLDTQYQYISSLRQTILQEAIEGKLTAKWREEHPELISGDNNASKLLEKVKTEKERLIKEGKIKKEKPLAAFTDNEKLFNLPDGWVWRRLGEISNFIDYRGKTPTKTTSGIRLITAKNVKKGSLSLEPEEFISEAEYQQRMTRGFPQNGDIFFTTEAPLGNVCLNVLTEKISVGQRIITIHPFMIDSKLLIYQLLSKTIQSEINNRRSGITAEGIKSSRFRLIPIPVPPLAEQQAIVSKVSELMVMIDELEKQLSERKEQSEMLMQSVLREVFTNKGFN